MRFEIKSYQSVGSIYFGMPRIEVRRILNTSFSEIGNEYDLLSDLMLIDNLQSEEMNVSDIFDELDIQVVYSSIPPHPCVAVTAYDSVNLIFNNRALFEYSVASLKSWMELMDGSFKVSLETVDFYGLGISLLTDDYNIFKQEPPKAINSQDPYWLRPGMAGMEYSFMNNLMARLNQLL
ncbi:MAG TPA: hypothetical protein IGS53_16925 [Leptolyngbyaceae cyanobacterium M33_DOE_097]|uniref:Uncharacterized protein n=1 Tax=Oscillatoriales cyanobacterium SpSt-418 TaxID=2282169 RepID=A0A7C3KI81_9CYAN|nr:hypothetical protein [Leptolyngbyaceae cyanobacterium M33_DOE_097]